MNMELVFAWVCYGTAFAAAVMNVPTTVNAWVARALPGQGPHFPDPIIAAVLGNTAWFIYGCLSGSNEATWVNVFCGFFQLVYLTTFLFLCTGDERRSALKSITWALLFLALGVVSRLAPAHGDAEELRKQEEFHKLMCTLAGAAAPVTPLLIAFFNRHEMNIVRQMIPRWITSVIGLINGLLWAIRGFTLWNMYMVIMNVIGAVCSIISLILILGVLNQQPEEPEDAAAADDDDDDDNNDDNYGGNDNYDGNDDDNYDGDDEEDGGDDDDDDETYQEIRARLACLRLIDSEPEEEVDPTV